MSYDSSKYNIVINDDFLIRRDDVIRLLDLHKRDIENRLMKYSKLPDNFNFTCIDDTIDKKAVLDSLYDNIPDLDRSSNSISNLISLNIDDFSINKDDVISNLVKNNPMNSIIDELTGHDTINSDSVRLQNKSYSKKLKYGRKLDL